MSKKRYEAETTTVVSPSRVQTDRDGHLVLYLSYPFLGSLALSFVFGLGIGGLAWLGEDFSVAKVVAAKAFLLSMMVSFPVLFIGRGMQWAGPRVMAKMEHGQTRAHTEPGVTRTRVIPLNTRQSQRARSRPSRDDADVMDTKEFCDVLFGVWPSQDLTRDNFARLFKGGQRLYYKYVGGRGRRGLWDKLGVIIQDGQNGAWSFARSLDDILSIDRDLQIYARNRYPPTLPS